MKIYNKQRGVVLITALLVAVVGFLIIMVALFIVYRGTQISGIEKRYKTALEASYGAAKIMGNEIIPSTMGGTLSSFENLLPTQEYRDIIILNVDDNCWRNKLTLDSSQWNCSTTSDTDLDTNADISFRFLGSGMAGYIVHSKIVETMRGNSNTSGFTVELEGSGVVDPNPSSITPMHFPFLYRIEFQGQLEDNPEERANLSSLYEY